MFLDFFNHLLFFGFLLRSAESNERDSEHGEGTESADLVELERASQNWRRFSQVVLGNLGVRQRRLEQVTEANLNLPRVQLRVS